VVVAVVALAALGIGSLHPAQPSSSARIAHLDSVIKCPSCIDLSIAQSDAPIAVGLRAEVAAWVHEGLSDARIEQLVVARFGEQALLVPSGSGADVLLWAVPIAVVGGAGALLAVYLWRRRRLEASR
jgi:cytochrome c-type biogenesis protein CcmH